MFLFPRFSSFYWLNTITHFSFSNGPAHIQEHFSFLTKSPKLKNKIDIKIVQLKSLSHFCYQNFCKTIFRNDVHTTHSNFVQLNVARMKDFWEINQGTIFFFSVCIFSFIVVLFSHHNFLYFSGKNIFDFICFLDHFLFFTSNFCY